MTDEEKQSFIDTYRELEHQRDIDMQSLGNTRRNAYQNIMSGANSAGMMYSNFPERAKYQYDTETYKPATAKIQTAYQTGLDKLRSNVVDRINKVADINADIANLNKSYLQSDLPKGAVKLNDRGDYVYESLLDGIQFRNAKGDPIRFGTAVKNAGLSSYEDIMHAAEKSLSKETAKKLKEITDYMFANGYTGITFNVGDSFEPAAYDILGESDRGIIDMLGIGFTK